MQRCKREAQIYFFALFSNSYGLRKEMLITSFPIRAPITNPMPRKMPVAINLIELIISLSTYGRPYVNESQIQSI